MLLGKQDADTRYLKRLRSVSAAAELAGGGHSWLPRASCDARCVAAGRPAATQRASHEARGSQECPPPAGACITGRPHGRRFRR
ncbi:hypothetical protein MAHJHV47_46230 [Mycobacterium avium subsp. hominissuis]